MRILPFTVEDGEDAPGWRRFTLAVDGEGGTRLRAAYAPAVFPDDLTREPADSSHGRWLRWTAWNLLRSGLARPVVEALEGVRRVVFVLPRGGQVSCPIRGSLDEWAQGIGAEYEARRLNGWLPTGTGESGPRARL